MKIFVSIISLRDPLLQNTLDSLINNKSSRHEATYCIFEQTRLENSLATIRPDLVSREDVKYTRIDPEYARGVGWPRYLNTLEVTDEDFFFQIDSHMLFDPNWDRIQIENYKQVSKLTGNKNVVITSGCKNFNIDGEGNIVQDSHPENVTTVLKYFDFDKSTSIIGAHGDIVTIKEPVPAIHICAGNLFANASWAKDVETDYKVLFEGEEQLLTLKSFEKGYSIYHPVNLVSYHYVKTHDYVTKIWVDPLIEREKLHARIAKSIKILSKYLLEVEEEMLNRYYEYSGVDYINKVIDERALSKTMKMPPREEPIQEPRPSVEQEIAVDEHNVDIQQN
jgi:hypothetical protein